ncbi:MAG: GTP-binding protein, partial [Christensenellaceae bacterium]
MAREPQETPVYLFLGFLEAGKTKFIQETLEDKRFDSGEKTLVILFEEGEEEYDPKRFKVRNVVIRSLEKEDMTEEKLSSLQKETGATRIMVEYNGMWLVQEFFDAMPEGWMINQMMTFFDANTFLTFNQNMRQLVFDKIQPTQLVVFNRFPEDTDKMAYHKICRAISRRVQIVYEYDPQNAEYDEIEDPLPYDLNAPVVDI